jgi:uncharacterized membrane protein YgcG
MIAFSKGLFILTVKNLNHLPIWVKVFLKRGVKFIRSTMRDGKGLGGVKLGIIALVVVVLIVGGVFMAMALSHAPTAKTTSTSTMTSSSGSSSSGSSGGSSGGSGSSGSSGGSGYSWG